MQRNEMLSEKNAFYHSREFNKRKIVKEGNDFLDKKTGIVYAKIIYSLNNIPEKEQDTPIIYLSSRSAVLDTLTEAFHYSKDKWPAERLEKMSEEEFDYIWLRQRTLLNRKPIVNWSKRNRK